MTVPAPVIDIHAGSPAEAAAAALDHVFFALSDPARRQILTRLDEGPLLVSELAAPFDISLQAVSRHIQVLVRAGLVSQKRTGRISRCSLVSGPLYEAAVWLNRYSKYWQAQFDLLAATLQEIDETRSSAQRSAEPSKRGNSKAGRRRGSTKEVSR